MRTTVCLSASRSARRSGWHRSAGNFTRLQAFLIALRIRLQDSRHGGHIAACPVGWTPWKVKPSRKARIAPSIVRHRNELPSPVVVHLHGGRTPSSDDGYPIDLLMPIGSAAGHWHGYDVAAVVTTGERDYRFRLEDLGCDRAGLRLPCSRWRCAVHRDGSGCRDRSAAAAVCARLCTAYSLSTSPPVPSGRHRPASRGAFRACRSGSASRRPARCRRTRHPNDRGLLVHGQPFCPKAMVCPFAAG